MKAHHIVPIKAVHDQVSKFKLQVLGPTSKKITVTIIDMQPLFHFIACAFSSHK